MKNPLTPAGIEPTTFRFVSQHLNHCATAVQSGPEVSRKLRFPDYVTTAQDGRFYPLGNTPGTHFC